MKKTWRRTGGRSGPDPVEVPLPRVTLLIDSLGPGGAQRQLAELAVRLRAAGWPVSVCSYYSDSFFATELEAQGIPVLATGSTSPLGRALSCRRLLDEGSPDVVISFLARPNALAELMRATSRSRFRLIVSERSIDRRATLAVRLRLGLHSLADAVVTNSETQAAFIRAAAPWLRRDVTCIRNCVDLDKFSPPPARIEATTLRVLTVASFVASKNPSCMVEGFALFLRRRGPGVATLRWFGNRLTGDGLARSASAPWRNATELARRLGIEDSVKLDDAKADIATEYRSADVFCLPSSLEGCPNVISEAMACGLPVLAGAVGDIPSLVTDGVHGFLFDPLRPDQIAEALWKFGSLSAEERDEMGRRCRARAAELFSPGPFVDAWSDQLLRATRRSRLAHRLCAG